MITAIIVIVSVVLAVAFVIAWLVKPALRRRVEDPKHLFADQVRQYDEQCQDAPTPAGVRSNDAE